MELFIYYFHDPSLITLLPFFVGYQVFLSSFSSISPFLLSSFYYRAHSYAIPFFSS